MSSFNGVTGFNPNSFSPSSFLMTSAGEGSFDANAFDDTAFDADAFDFGGSEPPAIFARSPLKGLTSSPVLNGPFNKG